MSLPITIALVDETGTIDQDHLQVAAMALNTQIADLRREWSHIPAAHVALVYKVTPAMWSIRIRAQLDEPGALGYHTDDGHQPYALVEHTPDWTTTVSHELCEMLVDPWGSRMHGARLPEGLEAEHERFGLRTASHHVHYLLEVCDPCEATSYEVNGVAVSDFLVPGWYRTNPGARAAYSFQGSLIAPREVDDGGYVSFATDAGEWWQVFVNGGRAQIGDLGRFDKARFGSLREFTDHHAREHRLRK